MGFVDDDQVKVANAELSRAVALEFVDQAHHGGVGGKVDAAFGIFFGEEVDGATAGEGFFEDFGGLVDEGDAIGEEEDAFDPVAAHEQVTEGDDGAGFAGAGGHDEESFTIAIGFKGFADFADGAGLVVASCDVFVDFGGEKGTLSGAALDDEVEFGLF